jgi:hypothetical protein
MSSVVDNDNDNDNDKVAVFLVGFDNLAWGG